MALLSGFSIFVQELYNVKTPEEAEEFLLKHGEKIVDTLGSQVDRIERKLKVSEYFASEVVKLQFAQFALHMKQ